MLVAPAFTTPKVETPRTSKVPSNSKSVPSAVLKSKVPVTVPIEFTDPAKISSACKSLNEPSSTVKSDAMMS